MHAGLHLEMPGSGDVNVSKIVEAVQSGALEVSRLDEVVAQLLSVILKAHKQRKSEVSFSADRHHQLARQAASESVVLLKNDQALLPLTPGKSLAVIGEFAKQPRFQGAGSSQVVPTKIDSAWDALTDQNWEMQFASGYKQDGSTNSVLLKE